jgi:hypothetical protein
MEPQPMDIDPIDDGPKALSSPVAVVPTRPEAAAAMAIAITVPTVITKEEEARQAIEMLRSEDLSARVSAANRLEDIATVLGPERTRDVRYV